MEGARWDINRGAIVECLLKEMFCNMPVIHVKAVTQERQDTRLLYQCPVYKTRTRGHTYVATFSLDTTQKPSKWILAGVAILLSV